jgi:hypothetical protein
VKKYEVGGSSTSTYRNVLQLAGTIICSIS